ncbi:MAG TPA: phosphoribosyltransferase [Bacillota bacterium]|nr:phosphoribosyltransferase [Candidatus Fermentithermobacillaceae bacterium]HOB30692.1 phosphoribosyltransferase [Bacillota bacterium]HOK64548.1 phosphoribosyltransferase [Bacillota bacterium]HOL12061.1 phosphoribosyltransferase [Bacillota bacterium]HOQ03103.1 phosphoribosyltransferase [Bacillota bacterium]
METKYVLDPIYQLTWDEVMTACKSIALEASSTFGPNVVVGIAKGGLIPATIIASILQLDIFPCVVTRKRRGRIIYDKPEVIVSVSEKVKGQRVLIVDEMVMTGETMRIVSSECTKLEARSIKTASIWVWTESWKPSFAYMESPGYVMFPWDYEVLVAGEFVLNPLYQEYIDSVEMMDDWKM